MPTYSYSCDSCNTNFELFFYIKDYIEKPKCIICSSKKTNRSIIDDVKTLNYSVKKSDTELKTLGDLAQRNSDKMSRDYKITLRQKHNEYKYDESQKELPKGMSRVKKQPKTIWPGTTSKSRRIKKNGK